ncbi:InlB B-repeat-containing protein [Treponema zioleckii]|uniref:InlB B-repeat-containing protein n=1 Tax=Treponema zioleckii TaxID=331680 RepID=UPI00168A93D4|nr:InlB B-repeat-containing protein [Treponema zioleckii]
MKNERKTFRTFSTVLKISLALLAASFALTLTSCGDGLKDDLEDVFSTIYTFYAENPDENSETASVSQSYEIGETLTKDTLPSTKNSKFAKLKEGYKINGWLFYNNPLTLSTDLPENISYTTDDGENESNVIQKILVTSAPATFYVNEWNPITYYIILDGNGGYFTKDDINYPETEPYPFTYDTAGTLEANPFTRNGYIFNGWLRNQNTNSTVPDLRNGAEIFNLTTTDEETIRLYALWLKDKIKITFDPGEGSGTMDALENVTVGDQLPKCTFTISEEGKQFSSWQWTSSDGNRQCWYGDEATLDEGNYPNEDATLTAQWDWIPLTVHFQSNSESIEREFRWGQAQNLPLISDLANENSAFTKSGHIFAGWNTAADGSGTSYSDGAEFSTTSEKTLYAQWTPTGASVDVKTNSLSVEYSYTETGIIFTASDTEMVQYIWSYNGNSATGTTFTILYEELPENESCQITCVAFSSDFTSTHTYAAVITKN